MTCDSSPSLPVAGGRSNDTCISCSMNADSCAVRFASARGAPRQRSHVCMPINGAKSLHHHAAAWPPSTPTMSAARTRCSPSKGCTCPYGTRLNNRASARGVGVASSISGVPPTTPSVDRRPGTTPSRHQPQRARTGRRNRRCGARRSHHGAARPHRVRAVTDQPPRLYRTAAAIVTERRPASSPTGGRHRRIQRHEDSRGNVHDAFHLHCHRAAVRRAHWVERVVPMAARGRGGAHARERGERARNPDVTTHSNPRCSARFWKAMPRWSIWTCMNIPRA